MFYILLSIPQGFFWELFRCVIKIFMAVLLGKNYLSCFVCFLSLTLSYYLFRGEKLNFQTKVSIQESLL